MKNCAALLLFGVLLPGWAVQAAEITEFSAYYEAHTNGMRGNAERHLVSLGENNYRLNVSLEAKMAGINIGDLEQASEFSFQDGRIVPHHYSYLISGISHQAETVSFNWDAKVALSTDDDQSWTLTLDGPVLDQLSAQLALARNLVGNNDDILEVVLVDGGEVEAQRYRVLGEEILETPMGKLNCVKLERIRASDNGRQTLIWFAKDWHNLLARIEQKNPSGLHIELDLERALVNGEQVTPLP